MEAKQEQQGSQRKRRARHEPQWIDSLVKLVTIDGRSVYDVAEQAGVCPSQVYRWVNKQKIKQARQDPSSEQSLRAELREVRRELDYYKKQAAFLKKAATYFASQSNSDSPSSEIIEESTR